MDTENKKEQNTENRHEVQINFWGSVCLSLFAVGYIIYSTMIPSVSTARWYDSPKLFPLVIGSCLLLFCLIYLWQNREGYRISKEDLQDIGRYLKSSVFGRLMVSILFLAIYIFVLLGLRIGSFHLPYAAATFIYLTGTMLFFRTKGFPVWKILVINLILSAAISYGFGHLARIPLP